MKGLRSEGCPWAAAGASLLPLLQHPQSFHQSLPSLASRVLACPWVSRERVSVANERMSEREWLQLRNISFHLCWHVGPTHLSGQQLISHLLLQTYASPDGPVELADCLVVYHLCWFDAVLGWSGIGAKLSCPRMFSCGYIGVDDVNRMTLSTLIQLCCCFGYEHDHSYPEMIAGLFLADPQWSV